MSFGANIIVGGELDRVGQVGHLNGGRLDYPFMPTKTVPYTEGILLEIPGQVGEFVTEYTPPIDIELTSIAVGANRYHPTDSWSVFVKDDQPINYICKNIYTKDVPEGIQLMAVKSIKAGETITFKFNNRGGQSKYAWVNYQGLRDDITAQGG
ncbi:hypothetical protein BXO87_02065 [Bacillus sp. GZB]|uniref:hypothetical protein n=1 Tax=Bacillus TaxID=1386 RepID=UPI000976ED13|nr:MULTISPECIES: hypothetical protein [Bacillus]MCZ4246911.1 hypothetical protein [Bacillus amyloliquefaciens]OMQ06812.1 hypothetical protein BXO87_02065 [Bacillus sp. GZB]